MLDKGIPVTRKDKFRNQRIVLTVYVPVGKQIRVDRNVGWGRNVRFDGPWNNNDWDIDIDTDNAEHGWDEDVDYIMKADGLYTLDGQPADDWKHKNVKVRNGRVEVNDGKTKVRVDGNGVTVDEGGTYRYDNEQPMNKVDSMKMKLDKEKARLKDSLQKASDKINKQLEKLDENNDPTPLSASAIPGFSPVIGIN
jgi:hypothetical protein